MRAPAELHDLYLAVATTSTGWRGWGGESNDKLGDALTFLMAGARLVAEKSLLGESAGGSTWQELAAAHASATSAESSPVTMLADDPLVASGMTSNLGAALRRPTVRGRTRHFGHLRER